jgi:Uma2 family endonuclease
MGQEKLSSMCRFVTVKRNGCCDEEGYGMSTVRVERPPAGKIVLTYDQYCALPDDGRRYELLEGELYMTPAPSTQHQRIVMRLSAILFTHVQQRQLGDVLPSPIDVLLSPLTVVQPDLAFVSQDRRAIITERAIEGAPDLVIEILSPTTAEHDRIRKAQLYSRYGVPHYWIIAPQERQLEVYELAADAYRLVSMHAGDDQFQPLLFPGLTIPLGDFWT